MLSEETMKRLMIAYDAGPMFNVDDFTEDAQRIVLVAKLIDKWILNKETNLRLMVNHVTIIINTFGDTGLYALYEYIDSFKECIPCVLTILYFMKKIDRPAIYDTVLLTELQNLD